MSKKMRKVLMVVYIITIVAILSGASLAYFTNIQVSMTSPTTNTTTATTGWLYFDMTEDIYINASQENFGIGMNSLSQEITTLAQLHTEGNTNEIYYYNIYLDIDYNDFEYTTIEKYPELILQIKDPEGKLVTDIEGLVYNSEKEGFDITNASGKFYIALNYPISASESGDTIHTWQSQITFVNMDSNQDLNQGKTINGKITVEKSIEGDVNESNDQI